uniref:Reverse transcriptase domain-containing protein n=1 Tax=Strigamia maritima TaxID=126957 RepID=T1J5B6_STRMM
EGCFYTLGEDLANVLDEATRTGAQLLLIGDFNARIGRENVTNDEEDAITRKSEDEVLNFEGKKLLTFCDNNALKILNGCCRGDYTGKFTFIGALGASVIDYAIVKEDNPDIRLDVLARTESDHLPLVVTLDWSFVLQPNSVSIFRVRWCWDKTFNAAFSRDLDRELQKFIVDDSVDLSTLVVGLNERIQSAAKTAGVRRSSTRKVDEHWFDRECKEEKRKVRRCLYKFRRSCEEVDRLIYIAARKALRLLYYKKKERDDDTWNKIRNSKNTTDFWRVVNSYRKGKDRKRQDIALDAWKQHFKILLNGTDSMSDDVNPHQEIDDLLFNSVDLLDREFDEQELNKAINKLKGGKSPGIDMAINEFYKAMSRSARSIVLKTLNVIWRTQTCPREWRIGDIIPIYKAGKEADTNNYRGITLLNTLYKIMTTMMTSRIQEWAEQEGIITENQAGFRKGYGTRDHLFTLNARRKEIEIVNGKYMKMILGLNFNTPDYLWAMELGRNDLECVAMKRVFKYVLHILKMDEKRWPLICLKEMINPNWNPKFIWWVDFEKMVNSVGSCELVAAMRQNQDENIVFWMEDALSTLIEQGLQSRWRRIDDSTFCPYYQWIKQDFLEAEYLQDLRISTINREMWTRIRCGNEHRGEKKWLAERDQLCRLCSERWRPWTIFLCGVRF